VADKKRRGKDADDERLDKDALEATDDAPDAEGDDNLDEANLDETDAVKDDPDAEDEGDDSPRRGTTGSKERGKAALATRPRTRPKADSDSEERRRPRKRSRKAAKSAKTTAPAKSRGGPIGFLIRFIREVVAELRKVVWPTRKVLYNYTAAVIVFVVVLTGIIVLLDYLFARGVLWVFSGGGSG